MTTLEVWPAGLPAELSQMADLVAGRLGLGLASLDEAGSLARAGGPLVMVLGAVGIEAGVQVLRLLEEVVTHRSEPIALVVGDGWIGTDGPALTGAALSAGAVALARSVAVRRSPTPRVNVVCAPERLFGAAGSQRGPLALEVGADDVAEVVAFALGEESSYVDGQVLYANGGRQLFSSLTA